MSSRWKTGIAAVLAVGTVFGASAVSDVANALPPGTPPQSAVALTPGSGTFATPFNFTFSPPNQACPGDNTQGWFFSPYLTADDPAALTFSAAGSPVSAGTGRTVALRDTGGNLQRNIFPNLVDGLIVSFPDLSLAQTFATTPLAPGDYNVGIACYNANAVNGLAVRENARYWNTEIRVTESAGVFSWTTDLSEAPSAPVIGAVNVAPTSATVNFTQTAASPAVTGYTATVTPLNPAGPAFAPIAVAPGASSFEVGSLTTGTEYSVSMIATNSVGDSPASNVVSFIPAIGAQPAIPLTYTAGVGGSGEATISWTSPTVVVPTGYTLTVAPAPAAPAPDSYAIGAGASSQVVTGLEPGTLYTFTLQPAYAPPVTGAASTVQGSVNPTSIIQQRITVTRPVGQLILTQRCGVNGDIPAYTGVDTVPGFPTDLPAIAASADQTGASPDIDLATPGVQVDPEFDNYPFPAPPTYPTECGIELGTSSIVTTGDGAGLYFKADGRIDEVTVSDTRDSDGGWTLSGAMTDFIGINTPANTFDGDWMGWIPQLQSNTANQTITTGPAVAPGTGVANATPGLGSGSVLGSAAAGAGLGISEFDARLQLLIPTDTPTDDYVGLLNFTVV